MTFAQGHGVNTAAVYCNYLPGILDTSNLISQQYHKVDVNHYSYFVDGETEAWKH